MPAQRRRDPYFRWLPHPEETDKTGHADQRGADIDNPWVDEVGNQILGYRKGHPADEDRGPDLNHSPPAGKGADQPGRHDQRKERQLPPDHGTEQVGVEPGDAGETRNRRTERAIGDGRGVGDQREARGRERREAEPDQHSRSDRDRRAKTGGTFEKSPKGKGDEQELQSAIRRYSH